MGQTHKMSQGGIGVGKCSNVKSPCSINQFYLLHAAVLSDQSYHSTTSLWFDAKIKIDNYTHRRFSEIVNGFCTFLEFITMYSKYWPALY